ncbi:hypothetical protein [Streptomyces sp. NPDC058653]|uniref:hypothetical protein n=1 Tax=Streptomyces sp. NPDC058653 TaxID=3346576 RepID=UPI003664D1DA
MSKGSRSLVASFALAVGLAFSTATDAAAADGLQATTQDSNYSNGYAKVCSYSGDQVLFDTGQGCFQPYGDWVWVRDLDANGIPVGVDWTYYPPNGGAPRSGLIYNSSGKDSGWGSVNKNFAEGGTFTWQTCEVTTSGHVYSGTCSESRSQTT